LLPQPFSSGGKSGQSFEPVSQLETFAKAGQASAVGISALAQHTAAATANTGDGGFRNCYC
jgi:glucose-6-phosphate isomerase